VAVDDEHGVVGFYSLSSFTLAIENLPQDIGRKLPRYDAIPAALIGRLARDRPPLGSICPCTTPNAGDRPPN
jgi:hypothetical protein